MSPDTIALIGAMLAGLIVPSLRERMARPEGLFEGFTRRESAPPA